MFGLRKEEPALVHARAILEDADARASIRAAAAASRTAWEKRRDAALAAFPPPDKPYRIRFNPGLSRWVCERARVNAAAFPPRATPPRRLPLGGVPLERSAVDYDSDATPDPYISWHIISPGVPGTDILGEACYDAGGFSTYKEAEQWLMLFLSGPRTEVYFTPEGTK